jgi:hypothetical protein
MCVNWKVLAGLGIVAAGVAILAPAYALAVLPLLILALCPVSMGVMLFAMRGRKSETGTTASAAADVPAPQSRPALQERLAVLRAEQRDIEGQLAPRPTAMHAANAGEAQSQTVD